MIAVTVARRPLQESTVASNTLSVGAGGMNVDGTRVGTHRPVGGLSHSSSWRSLEGRDEPFKGEKDQRTDVGRWPANLVLSHLPGCKESGEVATYARPVHGAFTPSSNDTTYGKGLGRVITHRKTETVPVWACAPGCPVAELDMQSGTANADSGGASRYFKKVGVP